MRYIIVTESKGWIDFTKADKLTDALIDGVFHRDIIIVDTLEMAECYRLDNDHQPIWEDIDEV